MLIHTDYVAGVCFIPVCQESSPSSEQVSFRARRGRTGAVFTRRRRYSQKQEMHDALEPDGSADGS